MRIRIIWALVLSLALGAAVAAAPARAQITIGVTPSVVEVSATAGSTGEVELTVLNQGKQPLDATIAIEPFNRGNPDDSVPDWLAVDQATVQVDAGGSQVVTVTVAIPENEPSGGRYAQITITTGGSGEEGTTAIAGRLIVPFLVIVDGEGDLEYEAEIERFAAVLELDGRLGFRTEVTNGGNVHVRPTGSAIVKKGDGSDYGTLDLQLSGILPDETLTLPTTSTLPMEPGGSYTATAELTIVEGEDPVTAETEFTFAADVSVEGSACENFDRGPTVTATLINSGNLGVVSSINMTVFGADSLPIGQTGVLGPDVVWPGDTTNVGADLPDRLQTGDYTLTIQMQTGASAEPTVVEVPFSIGGTGPNVAPICPQPESTPDAD